MKMPKIRKHEELNEFVGWRFYESGYTVFLDKDPHRPFWNYTISNVGFHPKSRYFSADQIAHHVANAQYDTRKDAAESALDWISRNPR